MTGKIAAIVSFTCQALLLCTADAAAAASLPFWRQGVLVARELPAGSVDARVQRMLLPGAALDVDRLLPPGAVVDEVIRMPPAVVVRLTLPAGFLETGIDDELLERLGRQLDLGLATSPELREIHIVARPPGGTGPYRTLPSFLRHTPVVGKGDAERGLSPAPLVTRLRPEGVGVSGSLDGKLVFLSQCHGWLDYGGSVGWDTQRPLLYGLVEDFVNPEAVNQYLIPYLENAGATVFSVRDRDLQTAMVIVDEGDGSAFPANGSYVESGDSGAFSPSGQSGFANFQAPYGPSTDPFRDTGGTARLITTTASETARATWTPMIPATGSYVVWVSYTRDGSNRASDAHYVVRHSGGETHLRVNQERHGWTWVPLGRYHCDAGFAPAACSVALVNDSAEVGDTVSADAVRFGGGMGDVLGPNEGSVSGRPRWEEGARSFVQYLGAPSTVYSGGDVTARSKWADYEHFDGEDSVYVSWHSNAFDTTARGTTSYIYSANPPDGSYDDTQAAAGSAALMGFVHDEIINDIRAAWDPTWVDRSYRSAYFGEINPTYNDEMPSVLLEVAFHDNAADALELSKPRFRQLLARAVYQGIVRYFADRDQLPVRLLPEPPQAVAVHATGPTQAVVSWLPPATDGDDVVGDAATSYRVYLSPDGKGFDGGTPAAGTTSVLGGLTPGQTVYLRVTAVNAGGESLPSETLVLRTPVDDEPAVLLVSGFDRLDQHLLVEGEEPDLGGVVDRMFLERMNRFDHVVEHAEALRELAVAVDSAANEAVASGRVVLDPATRAAVIWILGEESTADETFDADEQAVVAGYLAAGGRLFVSGAEIGWDLDHLGSAADRSFYRDVLRSSYVADDAGVYEAVGTAGSALAGIASIPFGDGSAGSYDVDYPDVIAATAGAAICARYAGGADGACVQAVDGGTRLVVLGFPFETIHPEATRTVVMAAVMSYLGVPHLFADGFESGDTAQWSASVP